MPSVVIIGAGNVGYHLSKAFLQSGVSLLQVCNHSSRGLSNIHKLGDVKTDNKLSKVDPNADIYIIAVPDDHIAPCAKKLKKHLPKKALVVHTSGSCPSTELAPYFSNYGSFYPLQSFKKDRRLEYTEIPFFVTANNKKQENKLLLLARTISNHAIIYTDEQRSKLHLPAVLVNNFTNHLFSLAYDYCQKENLKFKYLLPLIKETVARLSSGTDPNTMQTGPAIRKDDKTINRHLLQLAEGHPDLIDIYVSLSNHIESYHENRK